jgi:hypothetical protein
MWETMPHIGNLHDVLLPFSVNYIIVMSIQHQYKIDIILITWEIWGPHGDETQVQVFWVVVE